MAESVSVSTGIAVRYATALFDLALEENQIQVLSNDILTVQELLDKGGSFNSMIISPIYSREDMAAAVKAIAERVGLGQFMKNTLSLMASNRRLFTLPMMLDKLVSLLDNYHGIVTAEIISSHELNENEMNSLVETLRGASGKDIRLDIKVDESLIGGISARLGSRLVDATVKTKLTNLKNKLSEVK